MLQLLDSSQSLVTPAPPTASLSVQKKASPRAVQSSLRWQFCFGESAAGFLSVVQLILIDCALARYPCAHVNFRHGLKHL